MRALAVVAVLHAAACAGPTRTTFNEGRWLPVLIDETAGEAQVCGAASSEQALTYEDRLHVERVFFELARRMPIDLGRVRLILAPSETENASCAGSTVRMSTATILRELRGKASEDVADMRLAFLLGHELGHCMAPACAGGCRGAFDCERQADEASRALLAPTAYGYLVSPELLRTISGARLTTLKGALRRISQCVSAAECHNDRERATDACLSAAETTERYAIVIAEEAMRTHRGSTVEQRERKSDDLEFARKLRAEQVPAMLDICSALLELDRFRSEETACHAARLAAAHSRMREEIAVAPQASDRALWSTEVAWTRDALFALEVGGGPASPWDSKGRAAAVHALAMYEAAANPIGLRATYFGRGAAEESWALEALSRTAWPLASWTAVEADIAVGARRFKSAAGDWNLGFIGSVDGRASFAVLERVHVGVGVRASLWKDGFAVAFPVVLDWHIGNYGARISRSPR